jgi:arginyl-tRNA synthetase
MNIIKDINKELKDIFEEAGYPIDDIELKPSQRKDLGDFQINDCMKLASIYHKAPVQIANDIKDLLDKDDKFTNINIAGPGFINITLSDKYIIDSINKIESNVDELIEKVSDKKVVIDYGGANVAKALHVGHLRSANIGEALKRLADKLGYKVIGDAHLGDYGRPLGFVETEIKRRYPDLPFFDENFEGNYDDIELPITNEDLEEIYPIASAKAKEDEEYLEEGRIITTKIQHHEKGYYELWKRIVDISKEDIKKCYDALNVNFELWNGESDAVEYLDELDKIIKEKSLSRESEGAQVIDVAKDTDKIDIPPLLYIKSNGSISYATTDLCTLVQRKIENDPDEIWYVVDHRQSLHFTQVFRSIEKLGVFNQDQLTHVGYGTMNGQDGKPYKTRDGGIMTLKALLEEVYESTLKRINNDKVSEEEAPIIAKKVAVAALKYADLTPSVDTDYIFDIEKFTDIEGKTGPYVLYSTIRMKSLLNNAKGMANNKISYIDDELKEMYLSILDLPNVLEKAIKVKSLNDITEYLFVIASQFNTFYAKNKVLVEEDIDKRTTWLTLTKILFEISNTLLDILAIEVPEKM